MAGLVLASCSSGTTAAPATSSATAPPGTSVPSATTSTTSMTTSINAVPVQVVQTADGPVGYRSIGAGPPLVMIMGLSGSQDTWPPDLVDALATQHRVITFDNAGIGQTALPPGTLTISAMADQTADLISALHLGRTAVLGWSMGGMITQALVIRHPTDVSHLVLCATFSGDGTATLPPAANASALTNTSSSNTDALLALLFPPDQLTTQGPAYIKTITSYPNLYLAPASVEKAQLAAIGSWAAGTDPGGHGSITTPTLIGDGADDVLTPPVNAHKMARSIPGTQVVIYPDAGHGFVIQDAASWAARVNHVLR